MKNKRIFSAIAVLALSLSMLAGCGSGTDAKTGAADPPVPTAPAADPAQTVNSDPVSDAGEGIGKAVSLTNDEMSYVLMLKTQLWLDLDDAGQDEVVSLIARWWESVDGYVDPDLDVLKQDLNHQMETYFRNKVDIGLLETACDIRGIDPSKYPGADSDVGEGIGKTVPLTKEEMSYVLSLKTQSWLDLDDARQDEVISLIARWWDSADGYVDPDFDRLKQDLNHQMETYFRNKVDIGLFETACDIRGVDINKFPGAKG